MTNKYQKQIIKTAQLLNSVSPTNLQPYIEKYNPDFSANKLHSIVFLRLFLYSWMFDRGDISLRTIAQHSQSQTFKQLAQLDEYFSIGKTALSKRLARIPYHLFQDLFENLAQKTLNSLPANQKHSKNVNQLIEQSRILDSTIITLSSKLLKSGWTVNQEQLSFKASMAIQGRQIPVKALVLNKDEYASENRALPKLFDFSQKNVIYIFDRGIHKLQTYADIVGNGSHFLSRLTNQKYTIVATNKLPKAKETETIIVVKDELIIFPRLKKKNQFTFRLITAISKKNNQALTFISDLTDIDAVDITELYRYRWSIEIFFRFLKSQLHLESLLSYSENGIKVHIYLTLIAFLLAWFYKEQNNIKSFKLAREQLKWSLLDILMKQQFAEGFIIGATSQELLDTS